MRIFLDGNQAKELKAVLAITATTQFRQEIVSDNIWLERDVLVISNKFNRAIHTIYTVINGSAHQEKLKHRVYFLYYIKMLIAYFLHGYNKYPPCYNSEFDYLELEKCFLDEDYLDYLQLKIEAMNYANYTGL